MTRTFLTLVSLLLFLQGYATNVSGLISANTTWTKANSPYIVKGDIAIDTNASVTIEPGVEVRFDGNYIIYVWGKIIAQGTATDEIIFKSNSSTPKAKDWKGIEISYNKNNDTLKFSYCSFSHANYGAILIKSGPASIEYCTFSNNDVGIITNSSPDAYTHVSYCKFIKNANFGAVLKSKNVVTHCEFSGGDFGLESINDFSLEVSYNTFYYFKVSAINWCTNVHHNILAYNNIGIFRSNNIKYNQAWRNSVGIRYLKITSNDTVQFNSIKYNLRGIDGPVPATTVFNNNCIESNVEYNYCNYDKDNSNIIMNYWGTSDSSDIAKSILDFYDNFTSGRTAFIPVLATDGNCTDTIAIPPLSVINTIYKTAIVKVFPNPIGDKLTIESTSTITKITITDITGKIVIQSNPDNNKTTIYTDGLTAGVYLYKMLHADGLISTGKILKE